MKKLILLTISLVFLLSINAMAGDLFEGLIDTADIGYIDGDGEFYYRLNALEFVNGNIEDNGLEHEAELNYGLNDTTEVYAGFWHGLDWDYDATSLDFNVKHNFYNQDKWLLSVKGGYGIFSREDGYEDNHPYANIHSNYDYDRNTVLHNNLIVGINNDIDITLVNGLTYDVDRDIKFRAKLSTYGLGDNYFHMNVLMALENQVSDKLLYTGYVSTGLSGGNIEIVNDIKYEVMSDLTLNGGLEFNTESSVNNSLYGKVTKEINAELGVFADTKFGWNDYADWVDIGIGVEMDL
ncbi:MAG: hypothetical protein ACOCZ5_03105 [bacterium]